MRPFALNSSDFLGRWTARRSIEDALSGHHGQFEGMAEITERGDTGSWLYHEAGDLRYGAGAAMRAERRYLWQPKGAAIDVCFEDGRAFHTIALQGGARAAHWCDPDQYDVTYDFADWPHWRSEWRVSGPRKSYVMVTAYAPRS